MIMIMIIYYDYYIFLSLLHFLCRFSLYMGPLFLWPRRYSAIPEAFTQPSFPLMCSLLIGCKFDKCTAYVCVSYVRLESRRGVTTGENASFVSI